MDLARERESDSAGSKPKVLVTFHGYLHDECNLQTIPTITEALSQHLSNSQGRKIVFLENVDSSQSDSKFLEKRVNELGRTRHTAIVILEHRLNRSPVTKEVNDYMDSIANKELPEIIQEGLIPEQNIQRYFLCQALDRLREDFGFKYEYEYHPSGKIRESGILQTNIKLFTFRAVDAWHQGNFQNAVYNFQASHQTLDRLARLRDTENVDYLKRRVNGFSQNAEGGSVFSLFGAQHYRQAINLRQKFNKQGSIIAIRSNHETLLSSPGQQLADKLGTPEAQDIDCARGLLASIVKDIMVHAFRDIGRMAWYMQNYETLDDVFLEAVSEFSLDELKELCAKHERGLEEVTSRIFLLGPQRLPMP